MKISKSSCVYVTCSGATILRKFWREIRILNVEKDKAVTAYDKLQEKGLENFG